MHFRNSCTRSMSSCCMRHVPSGASAGRGVNGVIVFFTAEVPRHVGDEIPDQRERAHRLDGDRLVSGSVFSRVMHISRGLPLISAEQEPHLPALQFQRTARSGACVAWIWWTASSTTIPGTTSTE